MNAIRQIVMGFVVSCAAVIASGETYTWTGAANNTWNNADNWEGGKVFVSSLENDLVINKADAPIPNNAQVHNLTLNASVSRGSTRISVSGGIYCVVGGLGFSYSGGVNLSGENVTFDLSGGSISLNGTNPYCSIEGAGVGLTLTKSGGSGTLALGTTKGYPNFTGPLVIENGVVLALPDHSDKNVINKLKTTDVTVQGAGSQLQLGHPTNITQKAEIKLKDEATLKVSSGVQIVIRSLVIDGKKCAPGVWGLPGASGVEHTTMRVLGYGTVRVTDEDGIYEGGDNWSGRTAVWTRGAGNNTWTAADNWQDGYIPKDFDDVVFVGSFSGTPSLTSVHNLIVSNSVSGSYYHDNIKITGGFYLGTGGTWSFSYSSTGFVLLSPEVVFDLTDGDSFRLSRTTQSQRYFSGPGGMVLRGAGKFSVDGVTYSFTGPWRVESGKLNVPATQTSVTTTNLTFVGETTTFGIAGAIYNTNATVRLADGAKVEFSQNVVQQVKELSIDGKKCAAGTWGSPASGADHVTLRFVGNGRIKVWGDGGDYEGGDLWSGNEKHWIAAANGSWSTASNWAENEVPAEYDDIVIQSTATMSFPNTAPAIHNLTCETAFKVNDRSCKFLLTGDLTLKGGDFTFQWGGFTLLAGQHVIDTGAYSMSTRDMRIDGVGGLTKRGSGSINPTSATTSPHNLSFTGPLRIESGVFGAQAAMNSATTNVVVTGETSILAIDGAKTALNTNAVVRLEDKGRIRVVSGNTLIVRELWIDGKKCAAGTWGLPSTSADHKTLRLINPGLVFVREGGDYEGGDLWTGRTCTWLGTVNSTWKTAENWKDGEVAADYDDVIFDANYVNQPSVPNPFIFHNLILNKGYYSTYVNPFQASGGIYCVGGGLSFGYSGTIEALSKATVLDLTGGSISLSPNSGNRHHYLSGNGGFVVTKAIGAAGGSLTVASGDAVHVTFKGPFRVENGVQFDMKAGDGMSTKDVSVTGEGSHVKFHDAKLPTNSTVRLEQGGKVALVGDFTNDIAHLILDGYDRARHTYGGRASSAEKKLSKYFVEKEGKNSNLGVFNVTVGGRCGTVLLVR